MTDDPPVGGEPTDLTLGDVLRAAAEGLAGVTANQAHDGGLRWSVGNTGFATLAGGRAEFRLDPRVAQAALRTPDTSLSTRGAEWVAFAPATLDEGVVDRAKARFLMAYRRAGPPG
jgi:hypothetical protein